MSNRNNEDRLGTKRPDANPPTPAVVEDNSDPPVQKPVFNFTAPTELVELPSKGRYYPEGHPLRGKEWLEIRYMTAKDEDILTSKALLKKGLAIDRMLQNILVDSRVKPSDLLSGDKNALVVAARVTGYGAEYSTKVTCPVCGTTDEFKFSLEEPKLYDGSEHGQFEIEEHGDGTFSTTLLKCGVNVKFRLSTGADEAKLLQLNSQKKKQKSMLDNSATMNLKMCILSVDGEADRRIINSFVDNMPAMDARYLRDAVKKVTPNVELTQDYYCHNCEFEGEMEVPFTTDFFWPK